MKQPIHKGIEKKKVVKDNLDVMFKEVAKYIKTHGGKAIVMGGISVEKLSKYKFVFRIDFLGTPPNKVN